MNDIDENNNQTIEAQEIEKASCQLSNVIKKIASGKSENYINQEGQVTAYAFWANDDKISSYKEFQLAQGSLAQQWLLKLIKNSSTESQRKEKLRKVIQTGSYTVSHEEFQYQWDLGAKDTSLESQLLKALELTHALDRYSQKMPKKNFEQAFIPILELIVEIQNFPYLVSYENSSEKNLYLSLKLNRLAYGGGVGPVGAIRYYVYRGLSLELDINERGESKVTWGRPSRQSRFVLRDPKFIEVNSESFVKRVDQRLREIAQRHSNVSLLALTNSDLETPEALEKKIQVVFNVFADAFWKEPVQVNVLKQGLEGNSNAYILDGEMYLSYPYIKNIQRTLQGVFSKDQKLAQIERNLLFISAQEWIHLLQQETDVYAPNNAFYNNPMNAYVAFGSEGTRWYEEQPIEKDAKTSAELFVKDLLD
jgi:hypothetical protein